MVIHGLSEIELKSIPSDSVDMVFTSPPYANRRKNSYGGIPEEQYIDWFNGIATEIKRVLKDTGSFFLNIKEHTRNGERSLYVFDLVIHLKRVVGFRFVDTYAWTRQGYPGAYKGRFKNAWEPIYHFCKGDPSRITFNPYAFGTPLKTESVKRAVRTKSKTTRNNSGMGGGGYITHKCIEANCLARPTNVLYIPNVLNQHSDRALHPAVFPLGLAEFFIGSFTDIGDMVLDPFAGSGTVGVACEGLSRRYILIEKEAKYIPLIQNAICNAQIKLLV